MHGAVIMLMMVGGAELDGPVPEHPGLVGAPSTTHSHRCPTCAPFGRLCSRTSLAAPAAYSGRPCGSDRI